MPCAARRVAAASAARACGWRWPLRPPPSVLAAVFAPLAFMRPAAERQTVAFEAVADVPVIGDRRRSPRSTWGTRIELDCTLRATRRIRAHPRAAGRTRSSSSTATATAARSRAGGRARGHGAARGRHCGRGSTTSRRSRSARVGSGDVLLSATPVGRRVNRAGAASCHSGRRRRARREQRCTAGSTRGAVRRDGRAPAYVPATRMPRRRAGRRSITRRSASRISASVGGGAPVGRGVPRGPREANACARLMVSLPFRATADRPRRPHARLAGTIAADPGRSR